MNKSYMYKLIFILLTGLAFFSTAVCQAGEKELSVSAYVDLWLHDKCDLGKEGAAEKKLAIYGVLAERELLLALKSGPSRVQTKALKDSRLARWEKRRSIIESTKSILSKNDFAILAEDNKDAYIKRQVEKYRKGYENRALQGLAIVGGKDSLKQLNEYTKTKGALFKTLADKVINSINSKTKK